MVDASELLLVKSNIGATVTCHPSLTGKFQGGKIASRRVDYKETCAITERRPTALAAYR
jgi:hypothetical protein